MEHEGLKAVTLHGAGELTDSLLANPEKAAAATDAQHGRGVRVAEDVNSSLAY